MNTLKGTNSIRRQFVDEAAKNNSYSNLTDKEDLNDKTIVRSVLICRPNHRLGNQLLITPIIQEVIDVFPETKIDLFLKGNLGHVIFKNYTHVNNILSLPRKPLKEPIKYIKAWLSLRKKKYDIVINVVKGSSSGNISTRLSNSKQRVYDSHEINIQDTIHIAKSPVHCFRNHLKKTGFTPRQENIPTLNLKLSPSEIFNGQKLLEKLVGNNKKTISIFTHATDDKCYPESWWLPFYDKLKKAFPDFNIIEILPVENVSQIQFKAPTLYSKDIREMAALIANTEVFIGADGGVMHLASAAQTPTVGLFSRADQEEYAPYGNNSLAINTNHVDLDGCIRAVQNILVVKK